MNYYEELGISLDASLDELHQAYRLTARLLHPDAQTDSKLKAAAERQMIRINRILAVLSDPDSRFLYDESLNDGACVPAPPQGRLRVPARLLRRHWPWGLACGVLLLSARWYLHSDPPEPCLSAAGDGASAASPESTVHAPSKGHTEPPSPAERRQPGRPLLSSRSLTPHEVFDAPERIPPDRAERSTTVERVATVPSDVRAAVSSQAAAIPTESIAPALAGHWLYAARKAPAEVSGMYPPEFIEFFLTEEQGALAGRYWARYRIANKAVSPEVQFRVSGTPAKGNLLENPTTLQWVSGDGAKGQLKMQLRGANAMEVIWWTSEFGGRTALTSGTALLIRQQAR